MPTECLVALRNIMCMHGTEVFCLPGARRRRPSRVGEAIELLLRPRTLLSILCAGTILATLISNGYGAGILMQFHWAKQSIGRLLRQQGQNRSCLHFLPKYDWRLPEGTAPKPRTFDFSIGSDPSLEVEIRRRCEEIEVQTFWGNFLYSG